MVVSRNALAANFWETVPLKTIYTATEKSGTRLREGDNRDPPPP